MDATRGKLHPRCSARFDSVLRKAMRSSDRRRKSHREEAEFPRGCQRESVRDGDEFVRSKQGAWNYLNYVFHNEVAKLAFCSLSSTREHLFDAPHPHPRKAVIRIINIRKNHLQMTNT